MGSWMESHQVRGEVQGGGRVSVLSDPQPAILACTWMRTNHYSPPAPGKGSSHAVWALLPHASEVTPWVWAHGCIFYPGHCHMVWGFSSQATGRPLRLEPLAPGHALGGKRRRLGSHLQLWCLLHSLNFSSSGFWGNHVGLTPTPVFSIQGDIGSWLLGRSFLFLSSSQEAPTTSKRKKYQQTKQVETNKQKGKSLGTKALILWGEVKVVGSKSPPPLYPYL